MRKIQKTRKSSTEKDAGPEKDMSTEGDQKADPRELEEAASDCLEVAPEDSEEITESSDVWQHFVRLDQSTSQCKHCEETLSQGASLSILSEHVENKHPSLQDKKMEISSETIYDTQENRGDADSHGGQFVKDNSDGPMDSRRRRAGVWNHFVRLNKSIAKCKVCKRDLNYSASVSNLKRHLKAKHPTEHAQLTTAKVSFSWQKKEKERSTPDKGENRKRAATILNSDSEYEPETDDDSENLLQVGKHNKRSSKRLKPDVCNSLEKGERRKSYVWDSFEKVDQEIAHCTLCEKNMNYKSCLSNLKRHLQTRHSGRPTSLEGHEEMKNASKKVRECADENEDVSDPSLEKDDSDSLQIALDDSCSKLFKRRKSDIWNHFATLSKEVARCKHCHKNLNYRSSATNLKRHLRVKHPNAHAKLGQAKIVRKESGASSSNVHSNEPCPSKASQKESRNAESPAKRKITAAVQKAGNKQSAAKMKNAAAVEESSDEDSSVDNEMPAAIHDAGYEDSADENDENSPEKSEQRWEDSFSRIQNDTSAAHKEARTEVSSIVNKNGKQTISVPRVVRAKKIHAKRKRSRLWDFFTVLDEKFAECKTCKHKLVHKSGLSNLAKHYTMKHSLIDMASAAQTGMSEIEIAVNALSRSEAQVASESQPTETSGEPQPKGKSKRKRNAENNHWRCAIWKLFDKIDDTFSQCRSCHKRISHRSTNANLLKHTRIKHPEIYFKFEERLKDFSYNVNILVDHFFPESLISASTSSNSASQTVSSQEVILPHQEYQMSENHQPHMYDGYSFPVIFVQEEEGAVHTSGEANTAASVITSGHSIPNHAGGNTAHSYHMGGQGAHLPTTTDVAGGSHAQDPATSMNVGGNSLTVSEIGTQVPGTPPNTRGGHHPSQYMGEGTTHLPVVPIPHNGIGAHLPVPYHSAGGAAVPASFNVSGNYSQVLTTSFNMGGGVTHSNDRLLGMVEESNQLLRGMQSAIERQSDVLIRLAESIATGTRAS